MTAIPQRELHYNNQRDVKGIAFSRSTANALTSDRLESAGVATGSIRAQRLAKMIRECGSHSNLWTAVDLHREDGELFEGVGPLYSCGSRLCSSCLADDSRRSRRRVRKALESTQPVEHGERWRFLTLTAPKIPDASLLTVIRVFQYAWSLLRKKQIWFGETGDGFGIQTGVKGVEFTYDEGYHVHIHVLVSSRWITFSKLRDEWTECLKRAWRKYGLDVPINTESGKAIVDVRLVRPKMNSRSKDNGIGLDDAINEVCKYITKSESWRQIPDADLVEVANVKRWPRMFEVFGRARGRVNVTREAGDDAGESREPEGEATSLDTQCLSDGDTPKRKASRPLLSLPESMPMAQWERLLESRSARTARFRKYQLASKYPIAVFTLLDGEQFDLDSLNRTIERENQLLHASKREWETVYEYNPRWDRELERRVRLDVVKWTRSDENREGFITEHQREHFVI